MTAMEGLAMKNQPMTDLRAVLTFRPEGKSARKGIRTDMSAQLIVTDESGHHLVKTVVGKTDRDGVDLVIEVPSEQALTVTLRILDENQDSIWGIDPKPIIRCSRTPQQSALTYSADVDERGDLYWRASVSFYNALGSPAA